MSETNVFDGYPEISFIDDMSLEDALEQMKGWYQERYEEITGSPLVLKDGNPEKIRLDTIGYMYYQVLVYLDFMAKQNLLKYSANAFLDNMAARCGLSRRPAVPATVTIRFNLSSARPEAYIIPAGTRCTSGDDVFFYVLEDAEIPAGEISVDVRCECTVSGEDGNEYEIGEINELVDLLPYIQSVSNITRPAGGQEAESDDDLALRVYLAPSSYSTAGVEDAYVFWTKSASSDIGDVRALSPEPCYVSIIFVLKDGTLPGKELLDEVKAFLNEKSRKVLGDRLIVKAPDTKEFDIDVTYYINESERKNANNIKQQVESAVEEYKKWQGEAIGRDINPSRLEHLIMLAGAKRVDIRAPVFAKVKDDEIACLADSSLVYGGIEDD